MFAAGVNANANANASVGAAVPGVAAKLPISGGEGDVDKAGTWGLQTLDILMSTRVCGSPAVDGYAHVNATCLEQSPTAK
jgi:hypothetical protein